MNQLKNKFEDAYLKAVNWHRPADWAQETQNQHLKLIVVDEAFRLKYQALEQLRALWHGHRIAVHVTNQAPGAGVDTPEDLARVRIAFGAK